MRSSSVPTDSEVDAAVALLLSSPVYAPYFFERLENPNWIGPLKRRGLFASAPPLERTQGGGVRHPIWPASKYLARMAPHAPEEVAEILRDVETENPSILRDSLDAAGRMPPEIAATLGPTVCDAIKMSGPGPLFPNIANFCVQLAAGDQTAAALNLAEALFAPTRTEGEGPPDYADRYWYLEGLKEVVPLLAVKAPGQFLLNLCQWLSAAIDARARFGPDPTWDDSDHWRPAIEENELNGTDEFASNLVGFVRQGFEQAIDEGHIELGTALVILAGHKYRVFTRLRVHLINRFAERLPELACATMMDRELFKASQLWLWHEYAILMHRRFPMLSPDQQATWLGWIDTGPEEGFYWDARIAGREATHDDRRAWVEAWQAIRLHWIADYLSGDRQTLYRKISAAWEEPDAYDFHYYPLPAEQGWQSPISAEELAGLSLAAALDKINAWQPSKHQAKVMREGTAGLATAFGQYVGANAEELSGQAEQLERREPVPIYIFVQTFIEQMAESVKAGRKIDLAAVLRLCKWVVAQPISVYGAYIPIDDVLWKLVDEDWQWARYAVGRLVREVCGALSDGVPRYPLAGNRQALGSLLEPLAEAPAKSLLPEETAQRNLRVCDFLTAAINTPRGVAVEAIVAYARWLASHIARRQGGQEIVVGGFDAMPEVRGRLKWQITSENASFEAFAVIGMYFGMLHWIDESWMKANAERIFDLTMIEREPTSAHGWAAWNSFLDWGRPRASYYQILRPQYAYAVKHVAKAVLLPNSGRTPIHRLGEHLVVLYGRGNLESSSDDEKLLFDFLQATDSDVRSQTIAYVGSTFGQSNTVPPAVVERFQKLWEWYWPKFGEKDAPTRPASGLFGSWFRCEQFPVAWRLKWLEAVVALPQVPDLAEQLVARLATIAETHAEHVGVATRILDRMIRVDKEGWRAYAWRESAMKILRLGMRGDGAAREMALRLIDHLGRRGYQEFGTLLRHSDASSDPR